MVEKKKKIDKTKLVRAEVSSMVQGIASGEADMKDNKELTQYIDDKTAKITKIYAK